jgi:hypothetical protein
MQPQFSEAERDHGPRSFGRVAFYPISRRDLVANVRLPGVGGLHTYAAAADEPALAP